MDAVSETFADQLGIVKVERDSPIPAYVQIEQDLRRIIQQGYAGRVPRELELGKLYGVSRATIRQALARLSASGLIRRVHGSGTEILTQHGPSLNLGLFRSVTEQLIESGYPPRVDVLSKVPAIPPAAISEAIGLPVGETALQIIRLVWANETPISLNCSWFSPKLVPQMIEANLDDASIWTYLQENFDITIKLTENEIEVASAAAGEAEQLQVAFGAPLFKLTSVFRDSRKRAVEHSTSVWVPQYIRFNFVLKA